MKHGRLPRPHDLVTLEDLAIARIWEIVGLVEVLERKGLLTCHELYQAIGELWQRHPEAMTLPPHVA